MDNAYMESFNAKVQGGMRDSSWFISIGYAREVADAYWLNVNSERPHSSLSNLRPDEYIGGLEHNAAF